MYWLSEDSNSQSQPNELTVWADPHEQNNFMIFFVFSFLGLSRTIWQLWKRTTTAAKDHLSDVHTRLMKKNYEQVPQWWFHAILLSMVGLSLYACVGFDQQLQLPWWGLLLACGIALFFTLPIGVIQATTNQVCSCNHLPFLHFLTDFISQ